MYIQHAKAVQHYAQQSADNMCSVTLMTVLSIRQPWLNIGEQLQDVRTNKLQAKALWGFKKDTYIYLESNKHKMYAQVMAVINSNKTDASKAMSLMKIFLRVDGLGMAKAGFMCQLTAGLVGCMDSHNIKMYNLDAKDLMPAENFTYADLTEVHTTQDLIKEVLLYSKKYPQFDNQIAWLHAAKAISQKWPCKKNNSK